MFLTGGPKTGYNYKLRSRSPLILLLYCEITGRCMLMWLQMRLQCQYEDFKYVIAAILFGNLKQTKDGKMISFERSLVIKTEAQY